MGCFGYICRYCKTAIIVDCFHGGEKCVLIHIRHGEELGRVIGHYNEYGSVIEEDESNPTRFEGDEGVNSHKEIHESEFYLDDSYGKYDNMSYYKGKLVTYNQYLQERVCEVEDLEHLPAYLSYSERHRKVNEEMKASMTEEEYLEFLRGAVVSKWSTQDYEWDEYCNLPEYKSDGQAKSGIVAYHHKCYEEAEVRNALDLLPSDFDPNQSWGDVRDEFK